MNIERINKALKLSLWVLLASIVLIFALYWNIGNDFNKQVESGNLEPISGEGLGILGFLLYYYLFYLIAFIVWLAILNYKKYEISYGSKRNQLGVIFIFALLPTFFILLFLILASHSPFKQYPHVKRLEHEIENGKIIRYSSDSVKVYEADIINDKLIGKEITRYDNGKISSERNYKENVLDGESTEYYENGNKKSVTVYAMGIADRVLTFYENGQMSFLHDGDSLYSKYEWWENGQIKLREYNGNSADYWEQDGKQTLYSGNGKITIWTNSKSGKQREIIFKNAKNIRETSWFSNGLIDSQSEFIILNEKEAENIGCEEGGFRGYKDLYYYENGKLKSIRYRGNTNKNKSFNKTTEYDENGRFITNK